MKFVKDSILYYIFPRSSRFCPASPDLRRQQDRVARVMSCHCYTGSPLYTNHTTRKKNPPCKEPVCTIPDYRHISISLFTLLVYQYWRRRCTCACALVPINSFHNESYGARANDVKDQESMFQMLVQFWVKNTGASDIDLSAFI